LFGNGSDKKHILIDNLYQSLRFDLQNGKTNEAYSLFSPAARAQYSVDQITNLFHFVTTREYALAPKRRIEYQDNEMTLLPGIRRSFIGQALG